MEATFHRNEQTTWMPKKGILLLFFVKLARYISITVPTNIVLNFYLDGWMHCIG